MSTPMALPWLEPKPLTALSRLLVEDLWLIARVLSGYQLSESESDHAVTVIDTHAREIVRENS